MLTLTEAIKTKRLQEFIAQEEARGVKPANANALERAIKALTTQPQSKGRTSRSSSGDDSSGK